MISPCRFASKVVVFIESGTTLAELRLTQAHSNSLRLTQSHSLTRSLTLTHSLTRSLTPTRHGAPPRTLLERGPPASGREALQRFEHSESNTVAEAELLAQRFGIPVPEEAWICLCVGALLQH